MAALQPAVLLHVCHKGIHDQRSRPCGKEPDAVHFARLLRPGGERRGEDTAGKAGNERASGDH